MKIVKYTAHKHSHLTEKFLDITSFQVQPLNDVWWGGIEFTDCLDVVALIDSSLRKIKGIDQSQDVPAVKERTLLEMFLETCLETCSFWNGILQYYLLNMPCIKPRICHCKSFCILRESVGIWIYCFLISQSFHKIRTFNETSSKIKAHNLNITSPCRDIFQTPYKSCVQ